MQQIIIEGTEDVMKKYLSRAVCLILFTIGLCTVYSGFDYIISDDTSSRTRVTFHDYYEENAFDYLFLGTSHAVPGINSVQLSNALDVSVFNLATSAQDFVGAYYILKEVVNLKQTDHVFLEISISRFKVKNASETSTYIITDYMKSPLIRAEFLLTSFGADKYINAFLRLRRNFDPQNLPEFQELMDIYTEKRGSGYTQYAGTENYVGKGHWANTSSWGYEGTAALNLKEENLDNFTVDDIQEREWEYFLKIIKLCSDNGIDLTFYIMPYSELYLMSFDQYEAITQRVYDAAKANGIDIVDLNRTRDEYLNLEISDFINSDHVNQDASKKIATFLAQYIKNPEGDYFYDDINEKYPHNDKIIAVGYNRFFVTDKGEYEKKDKAKGTITSLRLEISALSHIARPVNVRIWPTVKAEDDESVWVDGDEITGEKLDDYRTQFIVPYNNLKTYYRVQLLDPDTNEVLYETITRFNMD